MFAQTSLLPQEEKIKVVTIRLNDDKKQAFNSKLSSLCISQQKFFEKCVDLFLSGSLNITDTQIEMNNILDIKKNVRKQELFHRADINIPLELYEQICDLAEQSGEPINHLSGKPVTKRVIIELLKIGLKTVKENKS